MQEIAISPSAGEFGVLDSLFHQFRSATDGYEFRSRRCVVPPSQQRGSEQVGQVNPGSKGDGLPAGILTLPHT
jgi:hypothetical protein